MINYLEFNEVDRELKEGVPLNLTHLGRIFGDEFWQLMVVCLTNITIKSDLDKIQIFIQGGK